LPGGYGFRGSVPRRQVWAEYYLALSEILQEDLPFPTGHSTANNEGSARSQLRAELKKVETIYQGLLFTETKFPKADEERSEVEGFVHRMMDNWSILNGRGWKEHDLGAGGRDSLCQGALDSLYGAAAKTYHSTAILRHMFTVHLAVAEFDLALMAFDSWFELVKKGKERVHKTHHLEPALDDDATMFETISACIAALCRYGSREAAEKAHKLAEELEDMAEKQENGNVDSTDSQDELPPSILALAWQSIGLAHAQWARMTYESESRSSIQEKAIQCLRKSLSPEFGRPFDVGGVFALGVLYAEQRRLSAAIELVKTALLADKAPKENQELLLGPYSRERSLIPLWHLLALMLSARQEYFMAARACEGAIEQFKDPHVLFGNRHLDGAYRSEHLNEAGIRDEKAGGDGIVDEMDDYEREGILQIKMTQLAILELVEGPAVAVNASTELLTLFPRLFGNLEQKLELTSKTEPPKSSAATLRSIRGSMFGGRADKAAARTRQSAVTNNNNQTEKLTTISSRPQTTQTVQSVATTALTLQPSTETAVEPHSSRRSLKSESIKRSRNSLRKRGRSGSRQRALSVGEPPVPPLDFAAFEERNLPQYFASPSRSVGARSVSRSRAGPAGQAELVAVVGQGGAVAPLLPFVQFSQDHIRRRRKGVLVKVWLVIAGFYRRAGLLEEAHEAVAEAQKVAQGLEADVVGDASGSLSVRQAGWGMEKSVEEVLADIWAEVGLLKGCMCWVVANWSVYRWGACRLHARGHTRRVRTLRRRLHTSRTIWAPLLGCLPSSWTFTRKSCSRRQWSRGWTSARSL
jgi:tetratricopeptide (TPR) repeat protein